MAKEEKKSGNWLAVLGILFALFLIGIFFAGLIMLASVFEGSNSNIESGNVAVIPIKGAITADSDSSFLSAGGASSSEIVSALREAASTESIKAIVLEIDSPGGAPVASHEIVQAVRSAKQNKTVVAWIRESGASGAYWVASSSDYIVADPLSMTGSIGVTGSYLDFNGFLENHNITYTQLKAGEFKEAGNPLAPLSESERQSMQRKIDLMHDYFVNDVKKNRNLSDEVIRNVKEGDVYLGMEALNLGLIDELGSKKQVESYITSKTGVKDFKYFYFEKKKGLLEELTSFSNEKSYYMGKGIGDSISQNAMKSDGNIALK